MIGPSIVMIAHTYASALLAVAYKQGAAPIVTAQLVQVLSRLSQGTSARIALANPLLARDAKLEIVQSLLKEAPSPIVTNLAKTLALHNRLMILSEVIRAYLMLHAIREGAIPLKIVTAQVLTPKEKKTIVDNLEAVLGAHIVPNYAVEPDIIGGLRIFIGPYLLDVSWSHKVAAMMGHLKHTSLEDIPS